MEAGAGDSLLRSPRPSCLPPPQLPVESQDTQDLDENVDDESESVNDVALLLSRGESPENDDLPPDEPSTLLASRIMRAYDNPSPPPRDLAHPGVNYVPGKDGQFPLPSVSVPPSPFRDINLSEHLNRFSGLIFDPPGGPRTTNLDVRDDISDSGTTPPHDFISSDPSFALTASVKSTPHEDLASADSNPSSSTHFTPDGTSSRSSHHVFEHADIVKDSVIDSPSQPIAGLHGQLIAITNSHESSSPPTQAVGSSFNLLVPSTSEKCPRELLPRSERQQSESSPPLPGAKPPPPPPSNGNSGALRSVGIMVPGEEKNLSVDYSIRATDRKDVPARPYLSPEPTSSIKQTISPVESINMRSPLATPSRTPMPPLTYPDFSQTTVQRPVIAPTPVRSNSTRRLNSPVKFSLEIHDIHRTPAQRVPIETTVGRGTPLVQRTVQLSTGSDQSRPGGAPTIRGLVFTRPALDDPARSPAKRIPMTVSVASQTKGHQTQSSPTRLGSRARSVSIEPRPSETILARSRSVDHCATISEHDNHGMEEYIFPMVPVLARAGIKLPYPLVSGEKPSSDLPPPILEEHENVEVGNTGTDAALGTVTQDNKASLLRQASTSSRIPRIDNKPYARPVRNGKAARTTTATATRAPKASQIACKKSGTGNSNADMSFTESANGQRLASQGSLKRKRGVDATVSHPVTVHRVVSGILGRKCAPKPAEVPSQAYGPSTSTPSKVPQPLKFRKVVDGMLSARYAPAKADISRTGLSDTTSLSSPPLSELSSSSGDGSPNEIRPPAVHLSARHSSETSGTSRTDVSVSAAEPSIHELFASNGGPQRDEPSSRLRRTSRTRKPAQQQYVLDVFNGNTSTRPPPARRKPQFRTEGDCFMGMSATALKALTTSNTTKNQQTVAVLATEVIRKEGLRPESPTVKARTIMQKQRDERDTRRRERAQKRAQVCGEGSGGKDTEGESQPDEHVSLGARADHDENDCVMPQKHRRGPGEEEDYETPERPERIIEPLRLEGAYRKAKPMKQVKWHQGLSTAIYLDEVDSRRKSLPKDVIARSCLAATSKTLALDSLGNIVDVDSRPSPELITENITVKRYVYDNDIGPEPIPAKMTRAKSKKSKS